MPIKPAPRCGNKRLELLARKEKILNSLKYYEQRIKAESLVDASVVCYDESSDSDCDLPVISNGPSIQDLKSQEAMLQVCLNATCELACLELLQYELSHTTSDPNIQGEPPVTKPGSWREVTAECRIDLVPFSITFYVHQADGPFGAKSYRGLQVLVVKKAHETELAQSILSQVKCPSDAVEVLRNYAAAYRSRRSTLAHLADKYDSKLYMELLPDGGCKLKCGTLLELSWVLENKKSPLTPFHHRMMFDLEYMDESYIKLIKQAHKQLSDPTIDTRDRTLLLAKIITTCLEAEGAHESVDSEAESVKKLEKRRITLETEAPVAKKGKNKNSAENFDENEEEIHENDTESNENDNVNVANDITKKKDHANSNNDEHIMAPPRSLPKKFKPKGKENMDQNKKPVKRSTIEENNASAKKAKIVPNNKEKNDSDQNVVTNDTQENEINVQNNNKITKPQNDKDKVQTTQNNVEKETEKASDKEKVVNKNNTNSGNKKVNSNNVQKTIGQDVNVKKVQENLKTQVSKDTESQKVVDKGEVVTKTKKNVAEKVVNEEVNDPKNVEPKSKPISQVTKVTTNKAISSKNLNKNEHPALGNKNKKSGESKTIKGKGFDQKNYQPNTKSIEKVASTVLKTTDKHQVNNEQETKNSKNANSDEIISKNTKVLKVVTAKKISPRDNNPKNDNITENVKNTKTNKTKTSNTANNNLPENNSKNDNTAKVDNPTKNTRNTFTINDGNSNSKNIVSNTAKINKIGIKKPQDIQKESTNVTKEFVTQKVINEDKNTNKQKSKIITNKLSFNSKKIISSTPKKVIDRETAVKVFDIKTTTNKNIINTKVVRDKPKSIANPKKMLISNLSHKNPGLKNKLPKMSTMKAVKSTNIGNFKPGNSSNDSAGSKVSKIPKKLAIPDNVTRNSLRLSPRRLPSAFKSTSDSSIKQNLSNIPRLMRKP